MWIGAAVQTKTNPATKQHDKQLLRESLCIKTHTKNIRQQNNKQESLCGKTMSRGYGRLPNRERKSKGEKTHTKQS